MRRDEVIHDNEAREHMNMSQVNVKFLSVQLKTLNVTVDICKEKRESLEQMTTLKDEQHKSLNEQHKVLLRNIINCPMKMNC